MSSGFCYFNALDRSFSNRRGVWLVCIFIILIPISVFNANNVDPDQTPHSAASDLGLHCLPMSLLWGLSIDELLQYVQ